MGVHLPYTEIMRPVSAASAVLLLALVLPSSCTERRHRGGGSGSAGGAEDAGRDAGVEDTGRPGPAPADAGQDVGDSGPAPDGSGDVEGQPPADGGQVFQRGPQDAPARVSSRRPSATRAADTSMVAIRASWATSRSASSDRDPGATSRRSTSST